MVAVPRLLKAAGRVALSARARHNLWHECQRRVAGEPGLPPPPLERILVVCDGNLCRSPYAAARLARLAPGLEIRSAGLAAGGGDPASPDAARAAERLGLSLAGHVTRGVRAEDVAWAQLVLGMEGHHAAELVRRWPEVESRTRLLGHFLAEPSFTLDDPWGQPDAVFDAVFQRIDAALAVLVRRLGRSPAP